MNEITRRDVLKTSGAAAGAALLGIGSVQGGGSDGKEDGTNGEENPLTSTDSGLVGTWTASPQQATPEAGFTDGFDDQTLRMIVRTSVGGSSLRIRLANTFGEESVTVGDVEVGLQDEGAAVVSGSSHEVTFGDLGSVPIPPGAKIYSDPVDLEVDAEQNLVVSMYFPKPTGPPTTHADSLKTSYIATGNHVDDTSSDVFDSPASGESDVLTAWYFLEAVDVVSPDTTGAIVTFGNSITDGVGSSLDADSTYPDLLAERINDTSTVEKSVLNAGIGGNRILNSSDGGGVNALARLDRDVFGQTGVTDVILLEGINDIGFSELEDGSYEAVTAEDIIWGMKQIIARVHAKGLNIYGATLTPFKGALYYYSEGEEKRQTVNEWIRTSGAFDGVFDFDEALQDPDNPKRLLLDYTEDNLHPNDAGYEAMAEVVDLSALASESEDQDGDEADESSRLTAPLL